MGIDAEMVSAGGVVISTGWCARGDIFGEAFEELDRLESEYVAQLVARPITVSRNVIAWPVDRGCES